MLLENSLLYCSIFLNNKQLNHRTIAPYLFVAFKFFLCIFQNRSGTNGQIVDFKIFTTEGLSYICFCNHVNSTKTLDQLEVGSDDNKNNESKMDLGRLMSDDDDKQQQIGSEGLC